MVIGMTTTKAAMLQRREDFRAGVEWQTRGFRLAGITTLVSGSMHEEQLHRYPIPTRTQPRVLPDPHNGEKRHFMDGVTGRDGIEWRVIGAQLQHRIRGHPEDPNDWYRIDDPGSVKCPVTQARLTLWESLRKQPTETVEVDE